MTASETTRPDGIPLPAPPRPGLRPLERRILQAIALVCAVTALLAVQWVDATNNVRFHLKPPEKVTRLPEGKVGELAGARWMVLKREQGPPPGTASGTAPGTAPGDVVELRLKVGVRPGSTATARAVGSAAFRYRLHDDEGRQWSARSVFTRQPRTGVAMLMDLRAKVPRSKADSLELEIQAPRTSRTKGTPLASLRFER